MSIRIVRAWNTGLCARAIEPWLSTLSEREELSVNSELFSESETSEPLVSLVLILRHFA